MAEMKADPAWKIEVPKNENIATMLSYSPEYYKQRIKKLGFIGKDTILLDAGCGAGYWSVAASYLNKKVCGVDLTEKYLSYAKTFKKKFNRKNIDLKSGKIEKLPYKDNYFDYIICYSVWMFTDKEKALKEFYRVLKPSGKIYLGSIIGYSWYPRLIIQGIGQGKISLVADCLRAMSKKIPSTAMGTKKILEDNGFSAIKLSSDANIGNKKIKVKPIYNAKRWGFWEIFEVLAYKKGRNEN